MGSKTGVIIFSVIAVAALILAFVYSGNLSPSTSGGLVAQSNNGNTSVTGFLRQISAIREISLDRGVFDSPVFKNLQDMSRELTPEEKRRPNPFAPIARQGASVSQAVTPVAPVATPVAPASPVAPTTATD